MGLEERVFIALGSNLGDKSGMKSYEEPFRRKLNPLSQFIRSSAKAQGICQSHCHFIPLQDSTVRSTWLISQYVQVLLLQYVCRRSTFILQRCMRNSDRKGTS